MRFRIFVLAIIAAAIGLPLFAYGQESASPIGLVDIQQIFREHKPFAAKIEDHQAEAEGIQGQITKKEFELQQKIEQLRAMKQDSKEFADLQKKAQKQAEELQAATGKAREAVGKKQLALNVELHKTIRAAIEKVARERNIKAVLNRVKLSLDSENPSDQVGAINQLVLFEDGIDITPDVLKILDAEGAATAPNEGKKDAEKKSKGDEKKAGDDKGKKPKDGFLDLELKK